MTSARDLLQRAARNPTDDHLECLQRALRREGYDGGGVDNPVIVDMDSRRFPLNSVVFGVLDVMGGRAVGVAAHPNEYLCVAYRPGGVCSFSGYDGFEDAARWCRYLIEQSQDPSRYRSGACWLDALDDPGEGTRAAGARFSAWLEREQADATVGGDDPAR